jgi:hypothetical protein
MKAEGWKQAFRSNSQFIPGSFSALSPHLALLEEPENSFWIA